MVDYSRSFAGLAGTFHRLNQADLFGRVPDPAVEAARRRFHRRRARHRRRDAIVRYLERPWTAWADSPAAARIARRFLIRFPERDLPDPADDLLTDRQAAARYHLEEAENEAAMIAIALFLVAIAAFAAGAVQGALMQRYHDRRRRRHLLRLFER